MSKSNGYILSVVLSFDRFMQYKNGLNEIDNQYTLKRRLIGELEAIQPRRYSNKKKYTKKIEVCM